ncbi:hypothetical protein HF325_001798 [Metschnikowia pulcherrima]|uniref:Radical SAM core domain-containing protein n=1 Tax=Metschnikowia pulcherrima TaxID=27326 RepID=A0A8H7LE76_9ASCO|nr:hypothetical protein HF325_001798 [Metschnikowia pulcherrima]
MRPSITRFIQSARPSRLALAANTQNVTSLAKNILERAIQDAPRNDWTREEIRQIYETPLQKLMFMSQLQHHKYHDPSEVQLCTLLNIKSGGCTEDCKYCSQSSRYDTGTKAEKMIKLEEVKKAAIKAKENGSTRFCMGAAWRDMHGRKSGLKKITEMVKWINDELKMETCVTLGMVTEEQATVLKDSAGRYSMREHEQFLCFLAGCNAIFTGEQMLTTACNGWEEDTAMLEKWGLKPMKSFKKHELRV